MKIILKSKNIALLSVKRTILIKVFCCLSIYINIDIYSQVDPIFTQYISSQGIINPAYTGTRENISALVIYRNQWVGFDGAPKTGGLNIHSPLASENFGVGLSVVSDQVGSTNTIDVMFAGSYTLPISTEGKLSFGLQGGIINRIDRSFNLTLKDNNDLAFLNSKATDIFPNFGVGFYYYTKRLFIGYSAPKILSNSLSTEDNSVISNTKFEIKDIGSNLYGGYVFPLSSEINFKPTMLLRFVPGAPLQTDIGANFLLKNIVWLGLGYRSLAAIVFISEIRLIDDLYLGYSFDFETNNIREYSNGTHEVSIRYDLDLNLITGTYKSLRFRSIRYF